MKEIDYFSLAAGLAMIQAEQCFQEVEFPLQEARGIIPLPAKEFDPDRAYDEKRDGLMKQYEIDRQMEAEGEPWPEEDE